jgi:hypothetical protein
MTINPRLFKVGDIVTCHFRRETSARICNRDYHAPPGSPVQGRVSYIDFGDPGFITVTPLEKDSDSADYFYDTYFYFQDYDNVTEADYWRLAIPVDSKIIVEHIEDQILNGYAGAMVDKFTIEKAVAEKISEFKRRWQAWPINQDVVYVVKHSGDDGNMICTISWYKQDKPVELWI